MCSKKQIYAILYQYKLQDSIIRFFFSLSQIHMKEIENAYKHELLN